MTKEQIADYIIDQFKSDSGIVLGIPAKYQDALKGLLKLAVEIARTEQNRDIQNIEKER